MKILLIGEYSNVHATLADGLKAIGHDVTVISDGTRWRNYPRDINLSRKSSSWWGGMTYMLRLFSLLPRMRNYDIVQLINPDFLSIKAERQYFFFNYLKRNNRKILIGAFGYDWYWVDAGLHLKQFKYGDFYIGNQPRTEVPIIKKMIDEWVGTPKGAYCQYVNTQCDAIPACLYEYQRCYSHYFPNKTFYLPLPIRIAQQPAASSHPEQQIPKPIRFFIGIDTRRTAYKGTDIMYAALQKLKENYPSSCNIIKAEHVPFAEYVEMMNNSDVILDQLYSYTPAMNALEAMSRGIVCVGGGEPENYDILNEQTLRPIINVQPTFESVYHELEQLVLHPERIPELKRQSIAYVRKHHDHIKVARQYEQLYQRLLTHET